MDNYNLTGPTSIEQGLSMLRPVIEKQVMYVADPNMGNQPIDPVFRIPLIAGHLGFCRSGFLKREKGQIVLFEERVKKASFWGIRAKKWINANFSVWPQFR